MIKLLEPELLLKVRREDVNLIKELLPECEREFEEIIERETPDKLSTTLKIVETEFMTPEQGGDCGGIIIYSKDRKIVCPNTLKHRLDLCFEELLPVIRTGLFPVR